MDFARLHSGHDRRHGLCCHRAAARTRPSGFSRCGSCLGRRRFDCRYYPYRPPKTTLRNVARSEACLLLRSQGGRWCRVWRCVGGNVLDRTALVRCCCPCGVGASCCPAAHRRSSVRLLRPGPGLASYHRGRRELSAAAIPSGILLLVSTFTVSGPTGGRAPRLIGAPPTSIAWSGSVLRAKESMLREGRYETTCAYALGSCRYGCPGR